MFENLGIGELIVILIIALVLFGPGKIPEVGKALGQGVRNFKRAVNGDDELPEKKIPSDKT